jgi:hypothetical protein
VDATSPVAHFAGVPVKSSLDGLGDDVDAVMVTDIQNAQTAITVALARYDENRVLVPTLLGGRPNQRHGAVS